MIQPLQTKQATIFAEVKNPRIYRDFACGTRKFLPTHHDGAPDLSI